LIISIDILEDFSGQTTRWIPLTCSPFDPFRSIC
jgi:phage terminase small subunit